MINDEVTMIRETAAQLFRDHCDRKILASAARGDWPAALWNAVESAGLSMALVSEDRGGASLPVDAGLSLIGLAAEHAAPIPLGETMIAAWLLDRAGLDVPAGPLTFAAIDGRAEERSGKWRISGKAVRVPWGGSAHIAAVVEGPAGARMVLLAPSELVVERGVNMANEPRDTLMVDFNVEAARLVPAPVSMEQVHVLGAAMRSIQIAGALKRASELAVSYAQQRVQFGRPLSQFQAVQQNLAVLATQAAVAGAAATMAATAIASGEFLPGVAIAKARASEAAGVGAAIAHQVHGAIGFTLEHDLQFSTKRLLSWRDEFGNEAKWNRLHGRNLAARGADQLWSTITAG